MAARRRDDPEFVRAKDNEYWNRPENKARRAANAQRASAQRRDADPEAFRAQGRDRWRRWRDQNIEHERARVRNVQATRLAQKLQQFVEHVDSLVVLEIHDGACGICGKDVDPLCFHVDHIIPLARGGEHSYANTQPAHPFCNISKGVRLPWEI